jgi:hypothetical protein
MQRNHICIFYLNSFYPLELRSSALKVELSVLTKLSMRPKISRTVAMTSKHNSSNIYTSTSTMDFSRNRLYW